MASLGPRVGAWLLDLLPFYVLSLLAYPLLGVRQGSPYPGLVVTAAFLLEMLVLEPTVGWTVGKRLVGLRVRRIGADRRVPLRWTFVRTVGMVLVVPPLFTDADGRGLHDRAAGAVVVRAR